MLTHSQDLNSNDKGQHHRQMSEAYIFSFVQVEEKRDELLLDLQACDQGVDTNCVCSDAAYQNKSSCSTCCHVVRPGQWGLLILISHELIGAECRMYQDFFHHTFLVMTSISAVDTLSSSASEPSICTLISVRMLLSACCAQHPSRSTAMMSLICKQTNFARARLLLC